MIARWALVSIAVGLGGCAARVAALDGSGGPLGARFDREAGAARVVALASPS